MPTLVLSTVKTVAIEKVKKDQLFKLPYTKTTFANVFTAEGYCRYTKKYTGTRYSDICSQRYFKKGTQVIIDFEF